MVAGFISHDTSSLVHWQCRRFIPHTLIVSLCITTPLFGADAQLAERSAAAPESEYSQTFASSAVIDYSPPFDQFEFCPLGSARRQLDISKR